MEKHKFNIVDIIAVVLIVLVLGFVGSKYLNRSSGSAETNTVTVRYTVLCEGVDAALYETTKAHLPSQLMASGALYDGYIESVEREDYYVLGPDGEWVLDPNSVNLYFTVEAHIPATAAIKTEIGKQEVRVGKSDYILKSQYIEFKDTQIIDVEWLDGTGVRKRKGLPGGSPFFARMGSEGGLYGGEEGGGVRDFAAVRSGGGGGKEEPDQLAALQGGIRLPA